MSETQNNVVPSQNNDVKKEKKGLKLAGYVVPWWIVIVVVLVLAYLAYDNHMLDFVCNPNPKKISLLPQPSAPVQGIPLPSLLPPMEMSQAINVPQNLKNLFA